MTLKKLGFMSIDRNDILGRSEMKKILAGSGNGGFGCYTCSNGNCVPFTGSSFHGTTHCVSGGTYCTQSGAACRIVG